MHGDRFGVYRLEFDADAVGLDGAAAEFHVGHDDVEDVLVDEPLEEVYAVTVFCTGDREDCVFVDSAEVVGMLDGIYGFFEPLAARGSEFGF